MTASTISEGMTTNRLVYDADRSRNKAVRELLLLNRPTGDSRSRLGFTLRSKHWESTDAEGFVDLAWQFGGNFRPSKRRKRRVRRF